uniref:Uncharacterized protein n=1 Tax=Kalanchoe fedtschenkoi TaxID=63787 RepID=A0A7N0R907_KALFE
MSRSKSRSSGDTALGVAVPMIEPCHSPEPLMSNLQDIMVTSASKNLPSVSRSCRNTHCKSTRTFSRSRRCGISGLCCPLKNNWFRK